MERHLWDRKFPKSDFPPLPCGRCGRGRLRLQKYESQEPQWSKDTHDDRFHDSDYNTERFVAIASCDWSDCGDAVSIAGDIDIVEIDTDRGTYNQRVLSPMFFFPSPPLFKVPKGTPELVENELKTSFQHYWSDLGSCATACARASKG